MNHKFSIGIDFGGTTIKAGIVSGNGKVTNRIIAETFAQEGPKKVIGQIKHCIASLLHEQSVPILGIGIGSPGIISHAKGTVSNLHNVPGWKTVALKRIIEKEFSLPVIIENDANTAAMGELQFGAGIKYSDFIMVTLGTGVGGGIIINKSIFHGSHGAAGEIGHISIDYNGRQCNCGGIGCVEAYIGNSHLINRIMSDLKNNTSSMLYADFHKAKINLTPKAIHQAAIAGDAYANSIIAETGTYLGYALSSLVNVLDIETIIVGGGVAGFGIPLFQSIQRTLQERVIKSLAQGLQVIPAKLKNDAGILGASALVFNSGL